MRRLSVAVLLLAFVVVGTACQRDFGTDLGAVAQNTGMRNITTSDGDFARDIATGYYEAYEWGIGMGLGPIPAFLLGQPHAQKWFEIYPALSNEELLEEVAEDAKADGAKGLVDVYPHYDTFFGCILGFYTDRAWGTGIAAR